MDWPELSPNPYLAVHSRDDVRVRGTRIDLSVIVEEYLMGRMPEQMALDYPSLTLQSIHGVLAYYLGNESDVRQYVECSRARAGDYEKRFTTSPAPVQERLRKIRAERAGEAA